MSYLEKLIQNVAPLFVIRPGLGSLAISSKF